jgi:hypothetical protein
VQIELHYKQPDSTVAELTQRTEHVLADLAPYANVTPIKTRTPRTTGAQGRTSGAASATDTTFPAVLRIDGHPVLPEESGQQTGITAGAVPGVGVLPTEDRIREHLTQALLKAGPSAIRLPLPHRRIVAIALILMVAGALVGQFLVAGPVLTFIGIALLPIGLATNGRRTGRQPLMLAALISSSLGAVCFAWYFGPLLLNSTEDAAPPAIGFLYIGLVFLATAWVAPFTALFSRRHLRLDLKDRLLKEVTDNGLAAE